jgi:polysaccharide biosynthesis transport protein
MYSNQPREITFADIMGTLWKHRVRFAATVLIVLIAALVYAFVAPPTWEGSQAIYVRDDAAARFGSTRGVLREEQVKNTQQTLLEIVHGNSLLKNVLQRVGPPQSTDSAAQWPSEKSIEELGDAVSLAPPKGTEFGKTEVFYLKVKDRQRDRAVQLTEAVYAELEKTFGDLRAAVAQSAITELQEAVVLNENNLDQATKRLSQIENDVGIDLVALRMLHQSPTGDTSVYRTLTGALDELRQSKAVENQHSAMLAMLKKAERDPLLMMAAPKELLDCHPGLSRLIQGLSESRLRLFAEQSRLTDDHPDVRAVKREEAGICEGIRGELSTAIEGVSAAQELAAVKCVTLEEQVADLNNRLNRLTNMRAEYSNLVMQVDQRRNLVEESQRNLSQARAAFVSATTSSVFNRMDLPDGGIRPVSASRRLIGLSGLLGSMLAGVGVVFLTAPISRREEKTRQESAPARTPHQRGGMDRVVFTRIAAGETVATGESSA